MDAAPFSKLVESVQLGKEVLLGFLAVWDRLSLEPDVPNGGNAEAWAALFGWFSGMHGNRKSIAFSWGWRVPRPAVLKEFHAARAF